MGKLPGQRAVFPIQIEEVPQLRRIHAAPGVHAAILLPKKHDLPAYHARKAILNLRKVKALGAVHQAQPQIDAFVSK